ncbi:MAG: hypothetical protein KIC84_09760 [Dysgonomonas mossii]|uniref:hypothetical protein n=1 Tax=Dysgonomonas mossii TaxID=163665 RepID=UPI0026EC4EB0|nr:hypothetical protein [Dysgonomonas mossii]MBS5907495.1 hypothetical protein [Dysgonomonas mossii]
MKILFIPFYKYSHQIPILVLYKKYFSTLKNVKFAILLPDKDNRYAEEYSIERLGFNYFPPSIDGNENYMNVSALPDFLKAKENVIKEFSPDIVVEDFDFESAIFCQENSIPTISIQRTGVFRTSNPLYRNPLHTHSIEKEFINTRRIKVFNYKLYNPSDENINDHRYYLAEYNSYSSKKSISANAKIIPGINIIEPIPECSNSQSYYYTGPLLPEDEKNASLMNCINSFVNTHKSTPKVFLTTGLVEKQDITPIFNILIKKGYAILTTVFPPYGINRSLIFYHPFLPLHFISEKVDLIIHQCGNGIYHYPLLHDKPAITLGTQCYDREEVALKLESLRLSTHVPSPFDDPNYLEKFIIGIDKFENRNLCDFDQIKKIKTSIQNTMHNFNVNDLIRNIV